jgi:hypothetical protein
MIVQVHLATCTIVLLIPILLSYGRPKDWSVFLFLECLQQMAIIQKWKQAGGCLSHNKCTVTDETRLWKSQHLPGNDRLKMKSLVGSPHLNLKLNGQRFGYNTRESTWEAMWKAMWLPCEPPSPRQFCFKLSHAKHVTCQLAPHSGRGVCLPCITAGQVWHDKFPNWVWL